MSEMAVARLSFLSRDEEELVHSLSLRSLGTLGVMVKSSGIVKMPESLVNGALRSAPKRITLGGRDPRNDHEIPVSTYPLMAATGLAVYTRDIDTGARRPTTNADLANFARLTDALDPIDICWTTVTATDVPQSTLALRSLWTALQNNTKHVQVVPSSRGAADARKLVELAALVAGGEEELRERPLFSAISCPIAPLAFDPEPIEAQAEYARAGIPIVSMSMSLSGMSAPVTIGGTLVNLNTENLASLVITQSAAEGAPFIYSTESSPINMATGMMDYAAHATSAFSAGAGQMAHRYALPSMIASWGTETMDPGLQVSFSELATTLIGAMSGSDLISGAGSIDSAKGACLEQVVIDSYLWEDCRQFMRGYEVSETSAALDVVEEVGHGNSFLNHIHTARNFRKELFFRDPAKRHWQATLSTGMVPEAKKVAKDILATHEVPPVDRSVAAKCEALIEACEKTRSG
jgi:trimethylamine--corrinoid protein Co-methyltransferase